MFSKIEYLKREKTQITKIENERGNVTIAFKTKRIIKAYSEQLYTKLDHLDEMNKFTETPIYHD